MQRVRHRFPVHALATLMVLLQLAAGVGSALAASHREAPLIALDPAADITDVYFFRSWEDPSKVVLVMNVIPGQEPSSGPNYFNFDDQVRYAFHLDTNANGKAEDVVYEVRFKTGIQGTVKALKLPVGYAGVPPIVALSGPDAAGIGIRQTYTVTEIRNGNRRELSTQEMVAVPSNVGPLTMPNYEGLAAQGIYPLANGGRALAGQRDETFYIDLGATFDTVNLRRNPPILTPVEDVNDAVNPFGVDTFSGFNVSTIALEIPISELTDDPNAVLGLYASTSRQKNLHRRDDGTSFGSGPWVQVARMANPLVNELIIPTDKKDRWNATDPENETQFVNFYLNPSLAAVLNLRYGTAFPTVGRTDLVAALLQYNGDGTCGKNDRCSELLRLNVGVEPTAPADQKRLGVLAGDNAGFPNGRRPNDDVTDSALRVVGGILVADDPAAFPRLGDGVNFNVGAESSFVTGNGIYTIFPFLPTPHAGRSPRHMDCGEGAVYLGVNDCGAPIP
jgi:Domain of unknown function (DUF4331)